MATLYRAETTLQDILGMRVGDELQLAGGDLPDYTEDDAGKALQVNQAGTGLEWGPGLPSYTSSDVGKVLTVGEDAEHGQTVVVVPEQTVITTSVDNGYAVLSNVVGFGDLRPGDSCLLTVNGASYPTTATDDGFILYPGNFGAEMHYEIRTRELDELDGVWFRAFTFEGNFPPVVTPVTGTYTVSLTKIVPAVAPVWQTGAKMYFVHVDAETMSVEEDFAEVTDAYKRMPVYLVAPDGNGLYRISNTDGENFFCYTFEVLPGNGSESAKLGITQIMIANTGSVTMQRYTADITPSSD